MQNGQVPKGVDRARLQALAPKLQSLSSSGFSKAAELAVSRGFAQALKGTGVTVNAVLPGPTKTEALAGYLKSRAEQSRMSEAEVEQEFFRTARPTTLLGRFTTPEEIAEVVAFVCSREASAISGAPVRADGGVVQAIT